MGELFGGKSDEEFILVWLIDNVKQKRSAWFRGIDEAAAFARASSPKNNVYTGVALSPKDHGPHLRLKIEGNERPPSSLSTFWSDVDIINAGHAKKNLPTTEEQAKTILFPEYPPSMLVHSGGGLQ